MKKKGKHRSTPGIGASLTPDYREKEESNNAATFSVLLHYDVIRRCHT